MFVRRSSGVDRKQRALSSEGYTMFQISRWYIHQDATHQACEVQLRSLDPDEQVRSAQARQTRRRPGGSVHRERRRRSI